MVTTALILPVSSARALQGSLPVAMVVHCVSCSGLPAWWHLHQQSVWALCGEHEPCYGELGELNWNKSMDGLGWTSWLQISISADVAVASARAGWSIHQFTQHGGEDA